MPDAGRRGDIRPQQFEAISEAARRQHQRRIHLRPCWRDSRSRPGIRRTLHDLVSILYIYTNMQPAGRPILNIDLDPQLAALETLKAALDAVFSALELSTVRARAFEVPVARDDDEGMHVCINKNADQEQPRRSPVRDDDPPGPALWDQPIPVSALSDEMSAYRARLAIRKIVRRRDQPPTRPDRLPGLVLAPGKATVRAVRAANRAKDAFHDSINSLRHNGRKLVHAQRQKLFENTELQHVLLLQAYRHIELLERPIEAVSFSWSGESRSVQRLHRSEVLATIERTKIIEGATSDWERLILQLPDPYFARVRRQAPFPLVNVRYAGAQRWVSRGMAALPIVLAAGAWPARVRDLPPYEPRTRAPRRTDRKGGVQVEEQPLIAPMHLHRYLPEIRERHALEDAAELDAG